MAFLDFLRGNRKTQQPIAPGQAGMAPVQVQQSPIKSSSFLKSQPGQFAQIPLATQQQQDFQNQLLQMVMGQLQGVDNFSFEPIRQQALKSYEQDIIPSIAERFSSMGEGGQTTGAFNQALAGSGQDLLSKLAALEQSTNLQRGGLAGQLAGLGLKTPFETSYIPRQASGLEGLVGGAGQGISSMLPFLLGLF